MTTLAGRCRKPKSKRLTIILGFGTDTVADYERTFRAMNTANIAVYPIDAVALCGPSHMQPEALPA
jgi:hypothetical protein